MMRIFEKRIWSCFGCPILEEKSDYYTKQYYCEYIDCLSSRMTHAGCNWPNVEKELKDWFENKCPLKSG